MAATISVNGGGGKLSDALPDGAGGGGSGGAILLEALTVTLKAGSKLCANGGGGGGVRMDGDGSDGNCTGPASGGHNASYPAGGAGSFDTTPAQPGEMTASTSLNYGGGGGGGGDGRIHITGTVIDLSHQSHPMYR
jgi:hypothetical protein